MGIAATMKDETIMAVVLMVPIVVVVVWVLFSWLTAGV